MFFSSNFALADEPKNITFRELPISLQVVSICESGADHDLSNGKLIRSRTNDIGLMQINLKVHSNRAMREGFNIYSPNGNLAYGLYLYNRYGLAPWEASSRCWRKQLAML